MLRRNVIRLAREEVEHILHLPLVQRLTHRKARRTLKAVVLSLACMFGGASLASAAHYLCDSHLGVVCVDAIGYGIHGFGFIPLVAYSESIWAILIGESV